MRKTYPLIIALLVMLLIAGCGTEAKKDNANYYTIMYDNGRAHFISDNYSYSVGIAKVEDVGYMGKEVTITMVVDNRQENELYVNPGQFQLITNTGKMYPYSSKTFNTPKPLESVTLLKGTMGSGLLVFETMPDQEPTELVIDSPGGYIRLPFEPVES